MVDRAATFPATACTTSVPGVYAAGDVARCPSMPVAGAQVILPAAEGTIAAAVIDQELLYTQVAPR
jgi:thioredoxin reductase